MSPPSPVLVLPSLWLEAGSPRGHPEPLRAVIRLTVWAAGACVLRTVTTEAYVLQPHFGLVLGSVFWDHLLAFALATCIYSAFPRFGETVSQRVLEESGRWGGLYGSAVGEARAGLSRCVCSGPGSWDTGTFWGRAYGWRHRDLLLLVRHLTRNREKQLENL